jgi:ankyrin repeat protein
MKMVHALLDYQFGNFILDDYFGMTLLMYAIHMKNYEMTKLLLCRKQIDCMNLKLNNGESIWEVALNTRNADIIKLLAAETSIEIDLLQDALANADQFRDEEMQRILHNVIKEKNKKKSCFVFCWCSCTDNKTQETIRSKKE